MEEPRKKRYNSCTDFRPDAINREIKGGFENDHQQAINQKGNQEY
jgi:hypothetical protein